MGAKCSKRTERQPCGWRIGSAKRFPHLTQPAASLTPRRLQPGRNSALTRGGARRIGDVVTLMRRSLHRPICWLLRRPSRRPGREARRGFAVVASEVTSFAESTARAIKEVAQQVTAILSATDHTVPVRGRDGHWRVDQIGAAIDQPRSATMEISRGVLKRCSRARVRLARTFRACNEWRMIWVRQHPAFSSR